MNSLLHHPITVALGWTLIHSLWQLTLLALVYRFLLWFPISRRAQVRYVLGMSLLTLALVFPIATYFQVYEPPLVVELSQNSADMAIPMETETGTAGELLLLTETESEETPKELSLEEKMGQFLTQFEPFLTPLVMGWALGVLIMGLRFLGSWLYLRNLRQEGSLTVENPWESRFQDWVRQMGIGRPVQLRYSPKVSEPLTLGHFKPLVLIPLGLLSQQSPQQIEALLLHELAHIRRYDFAFNMIQSWIEILFFFHPAIWWLSREIRESREHCCDDAAVAVSQDPLSYAQALTQLQLNIVKHPKSQLTMSASGNTSNFTQRIYRILGQPSQNLVSSRGNVFAILAFIATFFLAFQQQQYQEEEAMLDNFLENTAVDTTTLQNWLLFTIRPETQQDALNQWLSEVGQLSAHPFELELETVSGGIQKLRAFKTIDQEEQNMWELSHNEPEGMKKIMLVYDPILDMLYMQTKQSNSLLFYNLETDAFGNLSGEDLPFGKASESFALFPEVSFEEQDLDQLPPDRFTIEFTPQTTMDELLAWNLACSKLGLKLEYDRIGFDKENGKLVQISGVYTNFEGKTLPFTYESFSFVQFEVDRNVKTIPVALVAYIDSTELELEVQDGYEGFGDPALKPTKTFTVKGESTDGELQQIQRELASFGIQMEIDHIIRNESKKIQALHGRFIYTNKTFRVFKIEAPKASKIHVLPRENDPIELYLGPNTFGSQVYAPKVLNTPIVEGTTHRFGRHLNIKKGPEVFEKYGISNMWYMSSDAVFETDYTSFVEDLLESTPLYLNDEEIAVKEYIELNIPVDSIEEYYYRDPIAAKAELGKTFSRPVYSVYTFRPEMNGPFESKGREPNFIPLENAVDTPKTPLVILDGKVVRRPLAKKETKVEDNLNGYLEGLQLESDQIESINVLKDEAAIKKYGKDGKYGVVEITTKVEQIKGKGKIEKAKPAPSNRIKGNQKDANQPLLVLDGIILPERYHPEKFELNSSDFVVQPEEIKSISVLKDKSAIDKYGEQGRNGVVEITTKESAKVRLKIADFTLPNGEGRANPTMSQKRDDVLIIPKSNWLKTSLFINGKPYSESQRMKAIEELKSHKILGIGSTEYEGKWARYIYTDKAPEVLLNLALGQDPYKYPDTYLFLLNSLQLDGLSSDLEKIPKDVRGDSDFTHTLKVQTDAMEKPAIVMVKGDPKLKFPKINVLNKEEALDTYGTTGSKGLLVVTIDSKAKQAKEHTKLNGVVQSDTLTGQGYQRPITSKPPKNFPLMALGVSPNPSLGEITVAFVLEKKRTVTFSLYDLAGREIDIIGQQAYEKGAHEFTWNTTKLSAGAYTLVAEIDGERMTVPLAIK